MKFHCKKCRTQITKDLFLTKKWEYIYSVEYGDEEDPATDKIFEVPIGGFIKTSRWHGGKYFSLNKEYMVIPIPVYESGMGCCDVSHIPVSCICGIEIGEINYDCWQTLHSVDLYKDRVEGRN